MNTLLNELNSFFTHIGYEKWKDKPNNGIVVLVDGEQDYHLGTQHFHHLWKLIEKNRIKQQFLFKDMYRGKCPIKK
jgi:hypothetical protein